MGYRRNYEKEPYQLHDERWKKFEERMKDISEYLNKIQYDGFIKNCEKDKEYLNKYSRAIDKEIETQNSKIFSLPCEYKRRIQARSATLIN